MRAAEMPKGGLLDSCGSRAFRAFQQALQTFVTSTRSDHPCHEQLNNTFASCRRGGSRFWQELLKTNEAAVLGLRRFAGSANDLAAAQSMLSRATLQALSLQQASVDSVNEAAGIACQGLLCAY